MSTKLYAVLTVEKLNLLFDLFDIEVLYVYKTVYEWDIDNEKLL